MKAAEDSKSQKQSRVSTKRLTRGQGMESDSSDEDLEDEEIEEDEGDALLRDSSALKGSRGGVLEPGYLNIVRCVRKVFSHRFPSVNHFT